MAHHTIWIFIPSSCLRFVNEDEGIRSLRIASAESDGHLEVTQYGVVVKFEEQTPEASPLSDDVCLRIGYSAVVGMRIFYRYHHGTTSLYREIT